MKDFFERVGYALRFVFNRHTDTTSICMFIDMAHQMRPYGLRQCEEYARTLRETIEHNEA